MSELLIVAERFVSLNQFWVQLGVYRDRWTRRELKLQPLIYPGSGVLHRARQQSASGVASSAALGPDGPHLELLWHSQCEKTTSVLGSGVARKRFAGIPVTSLAFNCRNPVSFFFSFLRSYLGQ
jgi:hypothetical protein